MEYYLDFKNKDIIKFSDKLMQLEKNHPKWSNLDTDI